MPRRPRNCLDCDCECRGTRCKVCGPKYRQQAAKKGAQRFRMPRKVTPPVVTVTETVYPSWWTLESVKELRDGFTMFAEGIVKPLQDKKMKAYNWQTVPL